MPTRSLEIGTAIIIPVCMTSSITIDGANAHQPDISIGAHTATTAKDRAIRAKPPPMATDGAKRCAQAVMVVCKPMTNTAAMAKYQLRYSSLPVARRSSTGRARYCWL